MDSENNTPKRVAATLGSPVHSTPGTVDTGGTTFPVANPQGEARVATSLKVQNTDATNNLRVTLDGSANYWTLAPGEKETFLGCFNAFTLKASAGTAAYEYVVTV